MPWSCMMTLRLTIIIRLVMGGLGSRLSLIGLWWHCGDTLMTWWWHCDMQQTFLLRNEASNLWGPQVNESYYETARLMISRGLVTELENLRHNTLEADLFAICRSIISYTYNKIESFVAYQSQTDRLWFTGLRIAIKYQNLLQVAVCHQPPDWLTHGSFRAWREPESGPTFPDQHSRVQIVAFLYDE